MWNKWLKRVGGLLAIAAVFGGLYVAMREQPVLVDSESVVRMPMSVTINEEGVTRVKDIYTVSSPIAGHSSRTSLEVGDTVSAGSTVVASIHPLDPPFLDERTRLELKAAVEAGRSAVALAYVDQERVMTALTLARTEYSRAVKLMKTNTISESTLERAYSELKLQEATHASTEATIRLRQAELDSAEARLTPSSLTFSETPNKDCCVDITAPADGVVLKLFVRSEQALSAGTLIAEIGDPSKIEIVTDLLSSDAVRIESGAPATISDWGGDAVLNATVKRIDPAAFTKVSALGIEEQRVNVVLELNDSAASLGHGFRVYTRLTVWAAEDVLQIPLGALFRSSGSWAVFTMDAGTATLASVEIGHMNDHNVEIVKGLAKDQRVILYPNDLIGDGSRVENRITAND